MVHSQKNDIRPQLVVARFTRPSAKRASKPWLVKSRRKVFLVSLDPRPFRFRGNRNGGVSSSPERCPLVRYPQALLLFFPHDPAFLHDVSKIHSRRKRIHAFLHCMLSDEYKPASTWTIPFDFIIYGSRNAFSAFKQQNDSSFYFPHRRH